MCVDKQQSDECIERKTYAVHSVDDSDGIGAQCGSENKRDSKTETGALCFCFFVSQAICGGDGGEKLCECALCVSALNTNRTQIVSN